MDCKWGRRQTEGARERGCCDSMKSDMMLIRMECIKCRSLGSIRSGNHNLLHNTHTFTVCAHTHHRHMNSKKDVSGSFCSITARKFKACSLIYTRMHVNLLKMNHRFLWQLYSRRTVQSSLLISVFCVTMYVWVLYVHRLCNFHTEIE